MDAKSTVQSTAPAFETVKEQGKSAGSSRYVEPNSAFAEGLPAWSIEPPQAMVRRH